MFERFTDRARKVVVMSQEEARLLDHNYIGTEHLLLGLIAEEEGVGARALVSLGAYLPNVRTGVELKVKKGDKSPAGHIPFTPRAKKVLELALREALQLGHNYVGTEHVLLGLIREGEGIACQVLTDMGIGLSDVRQEVIKLLTAPLKAAEELEKKDLPTIQVAGNRKYKVTLSYSTRCQIEVEAPNDTIARLAAEGVCAQLNELGTVPKELKLVELEDDVAWKIESIQTD